jgi:hypothetical protein
MREELINFLDRHPIIHPTRLIGIEIATRQIRLGLEAYPWWKNLPPPVIERRIDFEFQEVDLGHLDVSVLTDINQSQADEVLEYFSVTSNEPGDWTDPTQISIICQSALPDPLGIYARLQSYLQKEQAGLGPRDFLNCPSGKLKQFADLTNSSHYIVARAPKNIAAFICADLDAQNVAHYQLDGENLFSPKLIVHWCRSVFTCKSAFAEY